MTNKNKNSVSLVEQANQMALQVSMLLMTAAATASLIDLPGQHEKRAMLGQKPIYAFAGGQQGRQDQTVRRERDDIAPHYISYSSTQRTPGRSRHI